MVKIEIRIEQVFIALFSFLYVRNSLIAEKSKEMELQTVNREDYIEVDLSVNHFSDGVAVTEEKSLSEQILSLIPFEFAH